MPIHFTVSPSERVVLTTALGIVSGPELLAHIEAKALAEVFDCDELFDARSVTLDLSSSDLIAIAKAVRESLREKSPGRSAVVTDSPMIYNLAKTFAELAGRQASRLQVFTEMESALRWLGRPQSAEQGTENSPSLDATRRFGASGHSKMVNAAGV